MNAIPRPLAASAGRIRIKPAARRNWATLEMSAKQA
jgi:hypothetical protein